MAGKIIVSHTSI